MESEKNRTTVEDKDSNSKKSNLCSCKLEISLPKDKLSSTRKVLGKILGHFDPRWRFIRIREDTSSPVPVLHLNGSKHVSSENNVTEVYTSRALETSSTQSLSVILFLHEERRTDNQTEIECEIGLMTSEPWQHHHNVELLNKNNSKVIATQKFYELEPGLPLWALARVHHGSEILRFNIFVRDFEKMKEYYERLIGKSCTVLRPGFCFFLINTYPGLEIHMSLKCLPKMKPQCTRSAALRLKFRKLDGIKCYLISPPIEINSRLWKSVDPEGNILLLEEVTTHHMDKNHSMLHLAKKSLVFV